MEAQDTAVFLQARLGSQRLPHKILFDLGGLTVLEQCMRRLSKVSAHRFVVLTDSYSFEIINRICEAYEQWECFQGPAQDVLARFVFASRQYGVRNIIRATADNPLVSFELANLLLDAERSSQNDYRAHLGIPYGAGVEFIRSEAVERAFIQSMDPYDHEHVCPFLYNNPEKFRIVREAAPSAFIRPELRLTLDTEEDYRFLRALFHRLGHISMDSLSTILETLYPVAV